MRYVFICFLIFSFSCTKEVGMPEQKNNNQTQVKSVCKIEDTISFNNFVLPLMIRYCSPCHQTPGTGGINLDNYLDIRNQGISGQLIQSVIHDTSYVIMPPPPRQELDSCEIKRLRKWVSQGCKNN